MPKQRFARLRALEALQDFVSVFDPGNETGGALPAAQIMWDAFSARFGSGLGSLLVLAVPLGTSFFCGLFSVTAAARCEPPGKKK